MPQKLILASTSPYRRELLGRLGLPFDIANPRVDETPLPGEAPESLALRLAEAKAAALWRQLAPAERRPVLAADTTVALEGEIFGKPGTLAEARAMLGRLSGRTHAVHTAVALLHAHGSAARISSSTVTFRELTPAEIDWYWHTGEPADKAGGYAVQGRAAAFISHIAGSYSGIMGLPLFETWELLAPVLGLTAVEPGP